MEPKSEVDFVIGTPSSGGVFGGTILSVLRRGSHNVERKWAINNPLVKWKYPKWVERFGSHQRRQEERGDKITIPQPSEIL